ncbi:MAG TPA: redoxin domain-containing protein [Elainellaceae cyanobacterium]
MREETLKGRGIMQRDRTQVTWYRFAAPGILAVALATVGCGAPTATTSTAPVDETATETAQAEETSTAAASAPVRVGDVAPEFTAVDSMGNTHSLSDFRGQVVVLEWTNHQCPYVGKHYSSGNMQKLQTDATADGAVWLSIISSAPGKQGYVEADKANELTESRDAAPTAVLLDSEGDIGQLYDARTTPHMFVIDEAGLVQYMGAIDSIPTADTADLEKADNYVQAALTSVLASQPVETTATQPYGCSVKYDG